MVAELKAFAGGEVQLKPFQQFISFNNRLAQHRGRQQRRGHFWLRLRQPQRRWASRSQDLLQQTLNAVEPQLYNRIGPKDQIGLSRWTCRVLGETMCKTKNGRDGSRLDY